MKLCKAKKHTPQASLVGKKECYASVSYHHPLVMNSLLTIHFVGECAAVTAAQAHCRKFDPLKPKKARKPKVD